MAISVVWPSREIVINQSDLTSLGGSKYELDVDQLRLNLKALEDDEEGIVWPRTHDHNTDIELSGVTYARVVEFINDYTINFEDGAYQVVCVGANHNIGDVKAVDNVSLIIGNAAGLIQVTSGSGVLPSDVTDIADAVWDESLSGHTTAGTTGEALDDAGGAGNPWSVAVSGNTTAGTFGELVGKKLLTFTRWFGLK